MALVAIFFSKKVEMRVDIRLSLVQILAEWSRRLRENTLLIYHTIPLQPV